jgi:hypothetical protein
LTVLLPLVGGVSFITRAMADPLIPLALYQQMLLRTAAAFGGEH